MGVQKLSSDQTVAEVDNLEQAELIRKALISRPGRFNTYVYTPPEDGDPWRIVVAPDYGGSLTDEMVIKLIDFCSEIIASWAPDQVDTGEISIEIEDEDGLKCLLDPESVELIEPDEFLPSEEGADMKEMKTK